MDWGGKGGTPELLDIRFLDLEELAALATSELV
jgi:hypothetical protein